jgi:hypothetical protein
MPPDVLSLDHNVRDEIALDLDLAIYRVPPARYRIFNDGLLITVKVSPWSPSA